jgi:pimeloyl-ACP methyl ester carboxylesterase
MTTRYSTAGFERTELTIGGVRTVVYSGGRGEPVVYLHGGGTWHGFEWARAWFDRFRVILPYHPGFGESADDPSIDSVHDYVLHYLGLFDALELEQPSLVGASFGGRIAAEFAISQADRLRRLALVAPAGLASAEHPMPDFARIPPAELPSYFASDLQLVRQWWPDPPDAAFLDARARERASTNRVARSGSINSERLPRWLHRVQVPTLVIWGRDDRILPSGLARLWTKQLPNVRLKIIDRAGHLLLDESPAAVQAVADFLAAQV